MSNDELLSAVLALSEEQRAALAASLLESLEPDLDVEIDEAWRAEIRARLGDLRSGRVQSIPWERARRMIFGD